ncbi:MAG TPA: DAK2 domain-containing protein [Chloroflexi bacterium]|nr:DAK2 domain-containing protein [Chloroflexota bacterium]
MSKRSTSDLANLFGAALQSITTHRSEINGLDGYNGNHGDNMVENFRMIVDTLQSRQSEPPAEALHHAGQRLNREGRGGTSQYYAEGLKQAAGQLKDHSAFDDDDIVTMVQTLLATIPDEGLPKPEQAPQTPVGASVLGQVLELATGRQQQAVPVDNRPGVGNLLGALLSGGQQSQETQQKGDQVDIGDVVDALLPAGIAYVQAKRSGADNVAAAGQALMSVLVGGQVDPLQARTPRSAAGSLVAQSILQAIAGRS